MLLFESIFYNKIDYYELYERFCKMGRFINPDYIYELFTNTKYKIVLYSIEPNVYNINIDSCPSGLIYYKEINENKLDIFIHFIGTKPQYRNMGYGSNLIKLFISFIQNSYKEQFLHINIILDSVLESVLFYEKIGFIWSINNEWVDKFHINKDEDKNEHFIMVLHL